MINLKKKQVKLTGVLEGEQSVSIKMLTEIYCLDKEDCHLRGKVKQKLLQHFDDEPFFATVSNNEAQVVMSKQVLKVPKQCSFLHQNRSFALKDATEVIRYDVVTMIHLYNLASDLVT